MFRFNISKGRVILRDGEIQGLATGVGSWSLAQISIWALIGSQNWDTTVVGYIGHKDMEVTQNNATNWNGKY